MPQLRPDSERPRTAPATHGSNSSLLDLGPLHQALPSPRAPLLVQQSRRNLGSPTARKQLNGKQVTRPLSLLQRTSKRPSTAEGSRAAAVPKRPSTSEGTSGSAASVSSPPSSTAEASSKASSTVSKGSRRLGDGALKALADGRKSKEVDSTPSVHRLPPDLLCQCFTSVKSLYYLVNCVAVCRAWREALLSDHVWKPIYLRWWHSKCTGDSLDGQAMEETSMRGISTNPPDGYDSWRSAFIGRFQEGKQKLLIEEKAQAVRKGYLQIRRVTDRYGKRVHDCVQGDAMRKLIERLGLTFNVSLNRGQKIRIHGKGRLDIFESSCIVRYPATFINSLELAALKSIEVTATSDRLLRFCPIMDHHTRIQMSKWEMVSTPSRSPGPLRLLQQRISNGVALVVGTLAEDLAQMDGFSGQEQVLLLVINLHLSDVLWKLMDLGDGPTSRVARRIVRDELDPHHGLHSWHVSVQFHTFGRNIWSRHFKQVFWNPRESIPGEKAVFLLVSHQEVFPGVLKLPWKSEAFSGILGGVYMLDFTLWDEGGEIAWQYSAAARIDPAPLAVVEYGIEFEGERVHTLVTDEERGVSVQMNMCIPLSITYWNTTAERPMVAVTNLQLTLTSKFLEGWCGVVNI